jgi:hypothetical protein
MPRGWTKKDERQYEHIKDSQREDGSPMAKAQEIAARTVNKRRRKEGRTENRRTSGTGNPNKAPSERTRDELYNSAREMKIPGRSNMTKAELVEALSRRR